MRDVDFDDHDTQLHTVDDDRSMIDNNGIEQDVKEASTATTNVGTVSNLQLAQHILAAVPAEPAIPPVPPIHEKEEDEVKMKEDDDDDGTIEKTETAETTEKQTVEHEQQPQPTAVKSEVCPHSVLTITDLCR